MMQTTKAQRADILHLIGHFGDDDIPIRRETLAALLIDAGAPASRGLSEVVDEPGDSQECAAMVLETLIRMVDAREAQRDALGSLTMDCTTSSIEARIAAGEVGIPVRNAEGRALFMVLPDDRGLFDHAARLRLAGDPT